MKVGDSRLVVRFAKVAPPPVLDKKPNEKSSLFYPSAGTDFLTPILLGLPYCTQFYFYDQSNRNNKNRSFFQILRTVKGVEFDPTTHGWEAGEGQDYFDFKFNGIPRRIHWVHLDNTNFLKEDVELAFYFHRGDSIGEGGSNQEWDSMLMPSLLKKIPVGSTCIYLTDGIPGGLETKYSSEVFEINMPFIERGRTYYCGRLDPSKVF